MLGVRRLLTAGDMNDEEVLAAAGVDALRARVVWMCAFGIAAVVTFCHLLDSPSFPIGSHPEVGIGVPVVLTVQGGWALMRGRRLSDPELMAALLTWPVMIAVSFVGMQKPGSPLAGEWSVLVSAIIVALLVRRRRLVVLMTVVVAACMAWIVWARLGATGLAPVTITLEVTVVASVIFAFRAVRDVAVQALATLAIGEVTDPLTGLANRRGLERYGPNLWRDLARGAESVAVIVVDIDHFKRINDTRGHAGGDVVLRQVADLISASLRHCDIAVRLGGEEFLVLASTRPGQAPAIAERLRAAVEDTLHSVTVSVGVHEAAPHPSDALPTTLWNAVDGADKALYAAKHSGRNRVISTDHAAVRASPDQLMGDLPGLDVVERAPHPRIPQRSDGQSGR